MTTRRADHVFFPLLAIVILATVFIGFARTYYAAGLFHAPLPNAVIQIHAAVFSCWLLMLAMQTGLVAAGGVKIHRKLGLVGFGLACLMVLIGLLAATDSLRRGFAPPGSGLDAQTFYIVPVASMALFATLTCSAYRARTNSAAHKRLIVMATVAILSAAIGRWPYAFIHASHWYQDGVQDAFLLVLVLFDLATLHRVHKVTAWGSALIVVVQQAQIPLGFTPAWHAFAHTMSRLI